MYIVVMYIDIVPNRSSPPAILVRESFRQGDKVRKRTIVNITSWPPHVIEGLKLLFKGKPLIGHDEAFIIDESLAHGHVESILLMIHHLNLDSLLCPTPCRQRDLVLAMIVDRLIHAGSKLATTRQWHMTTLASELGVDNADVDELYDALDWLLERQADIENALAKRHLNEGALVLYDVSSSYYEGHTCPLARFGNDRDGKKGLPIVVYGVLTDRQGRPVAVDVYPGNTGDPTTVPDQIRKLRDRFTLERIIIAGDRGMLTQTQLEAMKDIPGLGWISALRSESIRKLMKDDVLQISLFDAHNIAEISSADFPGERLIACYNPLLGADRARTRSELVAATEKLLQAIQRDVSRRTKKILSNAEIGIKVGKAINKYKVGKHFKVIIEHGTLRWECKQESIDHEAALDGIYVIRTSETAVNMSKEDVVRSYKCLAEVERAFRCFKGIDIRVRPIRHRLEDRVRAHIFLCMLVYYVEWHLRYAWAALLFDDEKVKSDRLVRDPVLAAKPSLSAQQKKSVKKTEDGLTVQSFDTLMKLLGTRCRNRCRFSAFPQSDAFYKYTELNETQKKAYELVKMYPVKDK